jgi:hypothetical protein
MFSICSFSKKLEYNTIVLYSGEYSSRRKNGIYSRHPLLRKYIWLSAGKGVPLNMGLTVGAQLLMPGLDNSCFLHVHQITVFIPSPVFHFDDVSILTGHFCYRTFCLFSTPIVLFPRILPFLFSARSKITVFFSSPGFAFS